MKNWLQILLALLIFVPIGSAALGDVVVKITEPADESYIAPCEDLSIKAEVTGSGADSVQEVRFYYNDKHRYRDRKAPWEYLWRGINRGVYHLTAKAITIDGTEYFSDPIRIKVGPVSWGEKLFNGSFDCGKIANWQVQTAGGTSAKATFEIFDDHYFDDQYYMFVDIEDGGTENWHVQMSTACPTDSGHVYEISFLADADDPKPIDVAMQENQEPWASQTDIPVDIDGPDLYGPFEFIATKTDPTNMLRFNVGNNKIPFYLDEVQVIDHSATGVKAKRLDGRGLVTTFELQQAYPNPFNMSTSLRYYTAKNTNITLELFDMRGRKVRTLQNGVVESGSHVARWDGRDDAGNVLSSGVYIARMVANEEAIPLVLTRKLLLVK